MSFSRFGEADVYVFEHVGGFIQCCGCDLLSEEGDMWGMYDAKTPREMLKHLDEHEALGDDVLVAKARIAAEYEDLDAPIEPYVPKAFPPEGFRDIANGE